MKNNPICHRSVPCPNVIWAQSIEAVKQEANAFVFVEPTNTVYYIDSSHKITTLFSGDVYIGGYNYIENPLNLRSQTCYDFVNNVAYHYNETGKYRISKLEAN